MDKTTKPHIRQCMTKMTKTAYRPNISFKDRSTRRVSLSERVMPTINNSWVVKDNKKTAPTPPIQ